MQIIPVKLLKLAVETVIKDYCPDFFKDRRPSPERTFCDYFSPQIDDLLKSYGFEESDSGNKMTYKKIKGLNIAKIRVDEALMNQDRRDLDHVLVRRSTMLSFQKNGDEINSPAAFVRDLGDDTFLPGDARHRLVWSSALGCEKANAYVIYCHDEHLWNDLREALNDMNGAERTEEERLYLVYRKVQQGGYGSIRDLCRKHGVSEKRFYDFRDYHKAVNSCKDKGLQITSSTPPAIAVSAVKAVEKGTPPEMVQKFLDSATPVNSSTPKVSADKVVRVLEEGGYTEESFTKAMDNLREEVGRTKASGGSRTRGSNRSNATKLMEGIDIAIRASEKGSARDIGMPLPTMQNYLLKLKALLAYIEIGIEESENSEISVATQELVTV